MAVPWGARMTNPVNQMMSSPFRGGGMMGAMASFLMPDGTGNLIKRFRVRYEQKNFVLLPPSPQIRKLNLFGHGKKRNACKTL